MEPTAPPVNPPIMPPPPPIPMAKPKLAGRTKLLYIFGGVMAALLLLAFVGYLVNGRRSSAPSAPTSSAPSEEELAALTSDWPVYTSEVQAFTIKVPSGWSRILLDPRDTGSFIFNTGSGSVVQLTTSKISAGSLDDYLKSLDTSRGATAKVDKTSQIKAGSYDGYERVETWTATSVETYVSYLKIQDLLVTFTLAPSNGKNSIGNEATVKDYRTAVDTFTLTSTANLGKDWKTYTSKALPDLAYSQFTLSYPQTWSLKDNSSATSLSVSIYRNNYSIDIAQSPIESAVCLFKDSPPFQGSSGDLRTKPYQEFTTDAGTILRRYFNANQGDTSTIYFCEHQKDGMYFVTPLSIGGLIYTVPAKYDPDVLSEMDAIVKTLAPVTATASASPLATP